MNSARREEKEKCCFVYNFICIFSYILILNSNRIGAVAARMLICIKFVGFCRLIFFFRSLNRLLACSLAHSIFSLSFLVCVRSFIHSLCAWRFFSVLLFSINFKTYFILNKRRHSLPLIEFKSQKRRRVVIGAYIIDSIGTNEFYVVHFSLNTKE